MGRPVALLLFLSLVAAACTGAADDESLATPTDQESPQGDGDESTGTGFADVLALVADTPENRAIVVFGSLEVAAEAKGLTIPDRNVGEQELVEFILECCARADAGPSVLGGPVIFTCQDWRAGAVDQREWDNELGFNGADIRVSATAATGPDTSCAQIGRFDPDHIADVVTTEPFYSDIIEVADYGDDEYYRWGQDDVGSAGEQPETVLRPIARGGRLFASDDTFLWALTDAAIEASLDAKNGGGSLADTEQFSDIVALLDQFDLVSGFLTDQVLAGADDACGALCDTAEAEPLTNTFPYTTGVVGWGAGWGPDPDGGKPRALLFLQSADEADTEANIDAVAARLSDGVRTQTGRAFSETVTVTDTRAEGTVGIVEVRAQNETLAVGDFLTGVEFFREPLIVNE